ncbi:MAG: lipopolysaccharide biosynthesis protein, partial [Sphingobacteriales bacterium]
MLTLIKTKIRLFWKSQDNERSLKVKRNIVYTFLIKGGSIIISLLLVPLTINYINPVVYGVWLTISALVGWINNFDIGLSNGLRNKIAHSLALGEIQDIKKYVTTTYIILFLISAVTFLVFFVAGSFFNWNRLLNINSSVHYDIWPIILIALGAFCIQFALQPVNTILIATHQPFKSSLLLFWGQLVTIIVVFILTKTTQANLFMLVIVMAGSPVLVLFIANIYLFATSLRAYSPHIGSIHFKSAKSLLQVGSAFFIIQLGALILYETDNIVITKTLGPEEVTTFNIAYKIFSVLVVAFSIVMTPYWSAFTDAYAKNDLDWIKHSIKKMRMLWLGFSVTTVLLLIASDTLYKLWIGPAIHVPLSLSISMAAYVIVVNWMSIYASALNGIGKLKIQLTFVVAMGIINIPISVFLINRVGVCGTVLANVLVMIIMNFVFTYQINLIVNNKARGI